MANEDAEKRERERQAALNKVRALMAKRIENGATEAEANAAIAKAAELMQKYDLDMSELDVRESGVGRSDRNLDPVLRAHSIKVAMAVAYLAGTRFWIDGSGATARSGTFYGLKHDVEIAEYLFDVCVGAMRREAAGYEKQIALYVPRKRETMRYSFLDGMAERLVKRLEEMARMRHSTGKSLVIVRDEVIDSALAADGINLGRARIGLRDLDMKSWEHGAMAGEAVPINSGIGQGRAHDRLH